MIRQKQTKRVGYYCWAGPGTIAMLQTKYFSPQIDLASVMSCYDYDYLAQVQEKFAITDFWASFSWGFAAEREQEHKEFLISRLDNFHKLGIKLHIYIQGTNLVYADYQQIDYWARDNFGRTVTYFKGRKVCCVNNPKFQAYFTNKLDEAIKVESGGIFIDNLQMGQMTIPVAGYPLTFYGCACDYCQKKYYELYGSDLKQDWRDQGERGKNYQHFRTACMHEFIKHCSNTVRPAGKEFGTNSYDPKFNSSLVYGFEPEYLSDVQDYLLFETHSFPTNGVSHNQYIADLASQLDIPVFNLSYRYGIGRERAFSQTDIDALFAESQHYNYNLLLKGSEFTTNAVWHNLRIEDYAKPQEIRINFNQSTQKQQAASWGKLLLNKPLNNLIDLLYGWCLNLIMEQRLFRVGMQLAYKYIIR